MPEKMLLTGFKSKQMAEDFMRDLIYDLNEKGFLTVEDVLSAYMEPTNTPKEDLYPEKYRETGWGYSEFDLHYIYNMGSNKTTDDWAIQLPEPKTIPLFILKNKRFNVPSDPTRLVPRFVPKRVPKINSSWVVVIWVMGFLGFVMLCGLLILWLGLGFFK